MPLDAICLTAVKDEVSEQIRGLKIDKVQQPERDVIILSLRKGGGQTFKLLLSIGAGDARIHLTEHRFENPKSPPMFCMLLRKHITGAKILEVSQPPGERVLSLKLEATNAIGVKSEKCLVIEMIGRMSTIVLVDSDGIIIDCLRRIGGELSGKRSVLPGLKYRHPPTQEGKLNPLDVTEKIFLEIINETQETRVDKWLISKFTSLSPLICREIAWRAYGEADHRIDLSRDDGSAICREFLKLMQYVKSKSFLPWMISTGDKKPYDFSYTQIKQYESVYINDKKDSFSVLLDEFFTVTEQARRVTQRCSSILKSIRTACDRLTRKLAAQKNELEETAKMDYFRECGDLITSNLHTLKKGQLCLITDDFYSESDSKREIKLDPLKTPQQNAAKYYKAYSKAKNARRVLTLQISKGESELEYLESVVAQLQRVENDNDLEEIRNELFQTGYIKRKKPQKAKNQEALPLKFTSSTGVQILVGRNNLQNDRLTLKTASKSDIWLHTQKIHGAHVIITCEGTIPDETTLSEAASIAAYYSSAREDKKVLVDYCYVKKVKKPSGGRPGMVIYSDYKTIAAEPDKELVKRLRDSTRCDKITS